jgi:hypothetical protein
LDAYRETFVKMAAEPVQEVAAESIEEGGEGKDLALKENLP